MLPSTAGLLVAGRLGSRHDLQAEVLAAERVARWQKVWDTVLYDDLATVSAGDVRLNVAGWNNSYTGLSIPAEEMREQVEQTVERILAGSPARVLEIGCGAGLILFPLAPRCERFQATDFSPTR